ncbi:diguanylate cyclase (GGDEF)-like protein [Kineococcus xinjiangensis]|uniref:Diguanylate cyclase (GGDEF)-like protein n=1 Tax=Kineococcus xinjiangensis TaxID=512762 RepID=A0A2S6IUX4_9ACTN|nr:diguanylate cyclase [Kineococcus xinjiangensis]PPK98075.1 diguanylate cyclase (GGDEF)-like protein [Kineococcus xinjiangensis]
MVESRMMFLGRRARRADAGGDGTAQGGAGERCGEERDVRTWWTWLLDVQHPDLDVRRRGRILVLLCAATVAVLPAIALTLALTVEQWRLAWCILAVLGATYAGALAAARRGRLAVAVCILLVMFLLAVLAGALAQGEAATHPLFMPMFVLIGGLVLRRRALLPVLAGAAVATWTLPLAVGGRTDGVDYQELVTFSSIVAGYAALIALVNNSVMARAFAEADGERRRAEELAAALQEANTDLEARVEERTTALSAALQRYEALAEQLAELSTQDHLTGLHNRRRLDSEIDRLHREHHDTTHDTTHDDDSEVCLAVADLDDFKRINDTHGHHVGDTVLRRVAEILRRHATPTDIPARMGGEEFVLLMPATTTTEARTRCEHIRRDVAALDFDDTVPGLRVTLSIGLATTTTAATATWQQRDDLLHHADALLYDAKRAGKNRVTTAHLHTVAG